MEASEVVERVDMLEYIGQYTELEEHNGEYWGLSPFKQERTPSFSVRPEQNSWFDFSSGCGGNLIEFIIRKDGCSVHQALQKLKAYAHITEDDEGSPPVRLEAARIAKKFRTRQKNPSKLTAQALPETVMDRYPFDRTKLQLWADEGIGWDSMKKFQVRYDPMDDRIVYPIRTNDGAIFCISGRTCDPLWKEKRLPKYIYSCPIGTQPALYAFWEHREAIVAKKEIILFEGCKSVLKADTWGIENTAALLTSHLSQVQLEVLIRLASFHNVRAVFALDSDVDITKDDHIAQLLRYARVDWVLNQDGLLADKMSPVDAGEQVWKRLYAGRRRMN